MICPHCKQSLPEFPCPLCGKPVRDISLRKLAYQVEECCQLLGVSRPTFYRALQKYNLAHPEKPIRPWRRKRKARVYYHSADLRKLFPIVYHRPLEVFKRMAHEP